MKIRMTTRGNMNARMKELYSTGVQMPFDCVYAYEVKVSDCAKIKKALHKAFEQNRVNTNREFFCIKVEQTTAILELFDRKDITNEVIAEIENNLTPEDKVAGEKIKSSHCQPMNYREMVINIGAKLTLVKDSSVGVTISGDKKVLYNGEYLSLTAITKRLFGITHAIQQTSYW